MKGQEDKFYLRIFDDNHPNDWMFFFVVALVCNAIYFGVLNRMEFDNNIFPLGLIACNLITPITMIFCEIGERRIYG